ncbi:hypothetical protein FRC09_000381 [Ceratobasidium sp. 395]|nr:hypothetical protein FRC09_000381 [Ceratobasidium sp. 395]
MASTISKPAINPTYLLAAHSNAATASYEIHIDKVERDHVVLRTGPVPESLSDRVERKVVNAAYAVASAVSPHGLTSDATKILPPPKHHPSPRYNLASNASLFTTRAIEIMIVSTVSAGKDGILGFKIAVEPIEGWQLWRVSLIEWADGRYQCPVDARRS